MPTPAGNYLNCDSFNDVISPANLYVALHKT